MCPRWRTIASRKAVAVLAIAAAATIAPLGAVSAQGLFEFLFGGLRPPPPPPQMRPHAAFRELFRIPLDRPPPRDSIRSSSGPRSAFCVRLCDGRYFPIQGHRRASAVEQCNALCPASPTKIFTGGNIKYAVASDGRRYADLDNAFVYRQRFVAGCTCNGASAAGVARVPATEDPTLRPGDIIATNSGLAYYHGGTRHSQAGFTPIDQARMSKGMREHLAEVKVRPQLPSVRETTGATPAESADTASPVEPPRQ